MYPSICNQETIHGPSYICKKKKRVLYIKLLHERRIPPLIRTLQELKQPHQRFSSRENTGNWATMDASLLIIEVRDWRLTLTLLHLSSWIPWPASSAPWRSCAQQRSSSQQTSRLSSRIRLPRQCGRRSYHTDPVCVDMCVRRGGEEECMYLHIDHRLKQLRYIY